MTKRGPDHQNTKSFKITKTKNLNIFFSRLKVIDLSDSANQPFIYDDTVLAFNGEIYNYLEIKKILVTKGYKFKTTSDTEVLTKAIHFWGEKVFEKLEGMWAIFYHNFKTNKTILSRDRFGEKPLFYFDDRINFFFGSEINYIRKMSQKKFDINYTKIKDFLYYGYKCLFKNNDTFFKKIKSVNRGEYIIFKSGKFQRRKKYYRVKDYLDEKSSYNVIKNNLANSIKIRLRSDVPIAHQLSGGIDSNTVATISSKKFGQKLNTFSIVSKDKKFQETKNINLTVNENKFKHNNISINHKKINFLPTLNKLINYYNSPVYTTTSLMNFILMQKIKKKKFKVVISGIGGDEIFSGYYHHYLMDLIQNSNSKIYKKKLNDWRKYIRPLTRNKLLQNETVFKSKDNIYKYVFQNFKWKKDLFLKSDNFKLKKYRFENFCKNQFKNRLMNELFNEVIPVVLHQDDLNAMYFSIENRAPLLDSKLVNSVVNYKTNEFIKNGYAKNILRDIAKKYVNKKLLFQREKIGFNIQLNTILNTKDKSFNSFINKKSKIYSIVKKEKIINMINNIKNLDGEENNFIFNFISCKKFIENFK